MSAMKAVFPDDSETRHQSRLVLPRVLIGFTTRGKTNKDASRWTSSRAAPRVLYGWEMRVRAEKVHELRLKSQLKFGAFRFFPYLCDIYYGTNNQ